jgi:RluA family pseudouridine synthase
MNIIQVKVLPKEQGMRLLAFLREKCPASYSVKALKRAIDNKHCKINGKVETFSSHILKSGDRIEIDLESLKKASIAAPEVLFEDEDLFICNKPAGLVSDNKYFARYKKNLQLVHRLDKETSGVLILVKTPESKAKMETLFKERQIHKSYLALVDGKMLKEEGTIDNYLGKKHSYQGQTIYGAVSKNEGVHAVTEWKVAKRGDKATLLLCHPLTGRTHQLRAHFSGIGHPILGDYQYGKKFVCSCQPSRHLLHASEVTFNHPRTGKKLTILAPMPQDFLSALEQLVYN